MLSRVSRTSLKSFRFAPATTTDRGMPLASVSRLRLVPPFARSVGLGPVFFPPERRLGHRAVHGEPSPVDSNEFVVCEQCLTQAPSNTFASVHATKRRWAD